MGLRVVYGRAGAGKTEFCQKEIEGLLKTQGEKDLIYIVPDQIAMSEELAAVKRFGAVGLNGVEVFTFRWYYEKLSQVEPGRSRDELSNVGRAMVIKRILNEKKESLGILKQAAEKRGFISTVEKTFREFKRYDINSEELITLVEAGIKDGAVEEKTMDLAILYNEYVNRIDGKYLDGDDNLNRLAKIILKRPKMPLRKYWIDGFKDFTPQELKVIEAILITGHELTVTLCTDYLTEKENINVNDIFAMAKRTFCNLETLAKTLEIKIDIVKAEEENQEQIQRPEQLDFLEKHFFSDEKTEYHGTDTNCISIFEAKEIWSEIDYTARRILKLCREEGYKFNEISVVTGELETYSRFLENVFKNYGIPMFLDEKKKIANHPLITVVTGIFNLHETNWSYESLFRLLKSGYWEMTHEEVDIFENFCLKYGIKGDTLRSDSKWLKTLEKLKDKNESREDQTSVENISILNNLRYIAVKDLDEFLSDWSGKKNGRELAEAFFAFLDEMGVVDQLVSETEGFLSRGDETGAALQEKTWSGFINILEQISEIVGDEEISFSEFGELIEIGFQELGASMAPISVDQVLVGDLDRSRHHKVKALFVMGTNEGTFPASIPGSGIISDVERKYMQDKGFRLAPDTTSSIFEKEYLVYRTFSAPEEKLFLSYPVADLSGAAKRPARVIKALRETFKNIEFFTEIYQEESDLDRISSPGPTLAKLFGNLSEGKQLSDKLCSALDWFGKNLDWKPRITHLEKALSYTTQSRGVSGDALKLMSGGDLYSSISKLEAYSKCPFSWFIIGALRAKDREVFQLNMMDIGNFIHEIIYETITSVGEMGKTIGEISDNELETIGDKICQMKSETGIMATKGRYKYLSGRIKKVAKRSLKMINEHFRRSKFVNFGNELEFGNLSSIGEAGIRLSDGSFLRLRGRIDRLDIYRKGPLAYCRIVDYKTGKKTMSMSDVYNGLELQLLGYMNSLMKNGLENVDVPIKPAASLYYRLDEPMVKGSKDSAPEDIEKIILKELRMSGLAVDESDVYSALDEKADSKDSSMNINAKKGLVTEEQMEKLCNFAEEKIRESGENIKAGRIMSEPICKEGVYNCERCGYLSICKFDMALEGNKGKLIRELPESIALIKIMERMEEAKDGSK